MHTVSGNACYCIEENHNCLINGIISYYYACQYLRSPSLVFCYVFLSILQAVDHPDPSGSIQYTIKDLNYPDDPDNPQLAKLIKDIAEHQQMWFEISKCIKILCNYIYETVMISPIQVHAISETVWFEVVSHNCLQGLLYSIFCHHLFTNIAQDICNAINLISLKIKWHLHGFPAAYISLYFYWDALYSSNIAH